MKRLRLFWPTVMLVLAGACSNDSPSSVQTPQVSWVVGLVTDSLTPASRLHASPTWAFYIGVSGGPNSQDGLFSRGRLGRTEVGRFARCLGPAVRFGEQDEVFYIAIGDTLYSSDSAAYTRNMSRLDQGGTAILNLLNSLSLGDSQAVLPGLVFLIAPSFQGNAPGLGRGATKETAVVRNWSWRDGGRTFAVDTAHASLVACGVN